MLLSAADMYGYIFICILNIYICVCVCVYNIAYLHRSKFIYILLE